MEDQDLFLRIKSWQLDLSMVDVGESKYTSLFKWYIFSDWGLSLFNK